MKKITMRSNQVSRQSLTLEEAFGQFIKMCTLKNLSPKTIETYEWHYKILVKYLDGNTPISEIDRNVIDDYIIHLKQSGTIRDITINTYLRSIRVFLYYLMKQNLMDEFVIQMLKVDKIIKETYTDPELKLLLKKPDIKTCDFTEYKTWVFSNYLLATGNRISSVLGIRIKDLDFTNYLINVTKTKNRKAQIIPMSKVLASILLEYMQYRNGEEDDYLFCNSYGEMGNIHTFEGLLQRYNRKRGVAKTSAHLYRHTFAKNWIINGGDIFRLQKILGHSDLTVVKEYVNMFSNDLSIDFDKFNPLDNMNIAFDRKAIGMR
ncbi:MAG: site-specific integrase [Herbinix sp.]|nr:site-specific integrase [Herbinix sp.]